MGAADIVASRPSAAALEAQFLEMLADERFADLGPWELNEYGEVIVSPAGGEHGRAQVLLAGELERQLGERAWVEQGVRRSDGPPVVPDVLWSDRAFFEAHKSSGLLPHPPRLCVEVFSPSNSLERQRAKCDLYVEMGAEEAWLLDPAGRIVEIYGRRDDGSVGWRAASTLAVDLARFWQAL